MVFKKIKKQAKARDAKIADQKSRGVYVKGPGMMDYFEKMYAGILSQKRKKM